MVEDQPTVGGKAAAIESSDVQLIQHMLVNAIECGITRTGSLCQPLAIQYLDTSP